MPVTRTATRALRKSLRRKEENESVRRRIKYLTHKVKKEIEGKVPEKDLTPDFQMLTKVLDKAAKKNVIHKNKAARLKSRLAQKINGVQKPTAEKEKPVKKVKVARPKKSAKK